MKIKDCQGSYYQVTFDRQQWVVGSLGDPSKGPKFSGWDKDRQDEAMTAFKMGDGSYRDLAYHNRLSQALTWLADRLAGTEQAADLAELREFIEDAHQRIEAAAALVTPKA